MSTNITANKLPEKFAGFPIKQPSEIQQHRGLCLSLSGEGGVGKTTLAETVRKCNLVVEGGKKVLFVDIEGGSHVIDDQLPETYKPEEGPDLGIIEVTKWNDLVLIMQQLIQDPGPFCGAIWDNMSEALELCKGKHGFYTGAEKDQFGKWDDMTNDMVNLFRQGRDLARSREFITIYCMWDTQKHEDSMGVKFQHRGLHFNPKLAEKFMGIVDVVGWLETPPKPALPYPPVLHFDKDPLYPTKMRMSPRSKALTNLPDIIYNPDLGDIVNTVVSHKSWPIDKHTKPNAAADKLAAFRANRQ